MPVERIIYLQSPRYAGSTLLAAILGNHSQIATIGERKKFHQKTFGGDQGDTLCSCGRPFDRCPKWQEIKRNVVAAAGARGLDTSLDFTFFRFFRSTRLNRMTTRLQVAYPRLRILPRFRELLELNQLLIDEIVRLEGKAFFLDTSKIASHFLFLDQLPNSELRLINLVRDPRAHVFSSLRVNDITVTEAADEWLRSVTETDRLARRSGVKQHRMTYEDFCDDPQTGLAHLLEFIGVEAEEGLLTNNGEKHIMGNIRVRANGLEEIRKIETWKEQLPVSDQRTVWSMTGNVAESFGYRE